MKKKIFNILLATSLTFIRGKKKDILNLDQKDILAINPYMIEKSCEVKARNKKNFHTFLNLLKLSKSDLMMLYESTNDPHIQDLINDIIFYQNKVADFFLQNPISNVFQKSCKDLKIAKKKRLPNITEQEIHELRDLILEEIQAFETFILLLTEPTLQLIEIYDSYSEDMYYRDKKQFIQIIIAYQQIIFLNFCIIANEQDIEN